MANDQQTKLNHFLVEVFNQILSIEEDALKSNEFKNLSIREMHVIEAVCNANEPSRRNRSADVAKALRVSAGTLTTAVTLLEKKGYLLRRHDTRDKRIVRLYATETGRRADALHQSFHRKMVSDVMGALDEAELDSLIKGLQKLQSFFEQSK